MAKLSAGDRAKLPDSAFAYVDSTGRRRLPINDESHVRNALSRFEQVRFEDDAAREQARTRLLNAAKRYGIVPVGFITGQFASERRLASQTPAVEELPTGLVTLLFTDIEGSTRLLSQLGDGYEKALIVVREMIQEAVGEAEGREVEVRADEYFAVFATAASALDASVTLQRELGAHRWPGGVAVRVRIGIHTGDITMTTSGYIGLPVNTAARVCAAGHGGQILVSGEAVHAAEGSTPGGISFRSLGSHELRGLPEVTEIYQIEAAGLSTRFPTLRLSGE